MSKFLPITLLVFIFTCCLSVPAQDLRKGVVRIKARTYDGIEKTGTGFIVSIDKDAAYVVTASHVIEGVGEVKVEFINRPGTLVTASVIPVDAESGLRILRMQLKDVDSEAIVLSLGSSKNLELDDISVIGCPQGAPDWTVTRGNITGKGVYLPLDVHVEEGSSGSPVIKDQLVVGVVTSESHGFARAVRVETLNDLLEEKGFKLSTTKPGMIPDFPGGGWPAYFAEFDKWPTPTTENGSITLGSGNTYVMRPKSNVWIGPGKMIEITPALNQDFVLSMQFRVESRNPSAVISLELSGAATDADYVNVYLELWNDKSATYSIKTGTIRSGALPVPHAIGEESIAERAELPAAIKSNDWSKVNTITLKREGGEMQFFVNKDYVKDFRVSVFPVERLGVGAAFNSTVEIITIKARTKTKL